MRFFTSPPLCIFHATIQGAVNATHLERAMQIAEGFDVFLETSDIDNAGRVLNLVLHDYGLLFPENPIHDNFFSSQRSGSVDTEEYDALEALFTSFNDLDYEFYAYLKDQRDDMFVRLGVDRRTIHN